MEKSALTPPLVFREPEQRLAFAVKISMVPPHLRRGEESRLRASAPSLEDLKT
jgi:hypothetical protein